MGFVKNIFENTPSKWTDQFIETKTRNLTFSQAGFKHQNNNNEEKLTRAFSAQILKQNNILPIYYQSNTIKAEG